MVGTPYYVSNMTTLSGIASSQGSLKVSEDARDTWWLIKDEINPCESPKNIVVSCDVITMKLLRYFILSLQEST